jgi:glutathione S-transferase
MLILFQAEWCPFSAAVRERLTELGLDFLARQVEPWPEQRAGLEEIPVLETEQGERFIGTRSIFRFLSRFGESELTVQHRERYVEHRSARMRDVSGVILERATPAGHAV